MGCLGNAGTQEKSSSENYILAEFKIGEDQLEEEQIIYNPINNVVHRAENQEDVNRELRECELEIDGEKIDFVADYKFPRVGIYTIKYTFKKPLIDTSSLFFYCQFLTKIDLSHFQGHKLKIARDMFGGGCELLQSINLSNLTLENITDMRGMFASCRSLKSVDLSNLKAKKVENIADLFGACSSLQSVNLSNFNSENVTDMSGLFSSCISLKSVDLSGFNTKNVTNMKEMFNACEALESINLNNFDTSNVKNMGSMFADCFLLKEINLSNFNTQKVEEMAFMFTGCKNLIKVNLSRFKISKNTKTNGMFYECPKLQKGNIITNEKSIFEEYEKNNLESF